MTLHSVVYIAEDYTIAQHAKCASLALGGIKLDLKKAKSACSSSLECTGFILYGDGYYRACRNLVVGDYTSGVLKKKDYGTCKLHLIHIQ